LNDVKSNISTQDHTKKYFQIDGYQITACFAQAAQPTTYKRVKEILLASSSLKKAAATS